MRIELSAEAAEFGREAARAFRAAGGDELVQRAEREPASRAAAVGAVLEGLGTWELEPRQDAQELEAAAALCRSAGYVALPYPLAERLARPHGADGLIVVAGEPAAAVAGLDLRWAAVTLDGDRMEAAARQADSPARESAFVTRLDLARPAEPVGHGDPARDDSPSETRHRDSGAALDAREPGSDSADAALDVALGLVLPCWTLLGMLDRAVDLAREHALVREQFGQPLAEFQSVQFQLTDAEVERRGADMLARYALWSIQSRSGSMVEDALALRLAALEAAEVVFRVAHQVHGALGFCDESPLSWLSRYSLPLRRLPFGRSGTEDLLSRRVDRRGLPGLFSEPTGA